MKILVVDDDPRLRELVVIALERAGYATITAADGQAALTHALREAPDLIVLDIGLPEMDGLEVCRRIRHGSDVPILFLTARDDEIDRVLGLEMGADDYVTKPFSPRELVARVRARLRRHEGGDAQRKGRFEVDATAHRIRYAGQWLDLTRYEHALLAELLRRPGAILSRAQLLDRAWEDALESGERTVDTHVKTLRAKLRAQDPARDPIHTHRGLGYSIDVD